MPKTQTKAQSKGRGRPISKRGLRLRKMLKAGKAPAKVAKTLSFPVSYVYRVRRDLFEAVKAKRALRTAVVVVAGSKLAESFPSIESQFVSVRNSYTREVGR